MKNVQHFQQPVWFFNYEGEIETSTLGDFLAEYWNDETTSPRGVENREQVASVLVEDGDVVTYSLNDRDGLCPDTDQVKMWAVYSWGSGGRGPAKMVSELYDTEEEAQVRILEGMEYDMQTKSSDRPMPYSSEEEIRNFREEMFLEKINQKMRDRY